MINDQIQTNTIIGMDRY